MVFFKKVNPAFACLLGYSEEELTSKPFMHFVHPEDVNATVISHKDAMSDKLNYVFENRYRTKLGGWKWISWSSSEVLNENGLIYAYGKDVTQEKELKETLDKVYRLSRIGAWELEMATSKLIWSPVTREIHETTEDYEPKLEDGILFYKEGESREKISRVVEQAIKNGISYSEELQIVTAKGNEKWIRAMGEPEMIDGKCVRLYGSFQDIDERKKAQLSFVTTLEERNTILESIGDAFFALDKDWIITYWNNAASRIFRLSAAEMVGQNLLTYFGDALSPNITDYYYTMMNDRKPVHYERFFSPLKDGLKSALIHPIQAYPCI
eukprot:Opistho-1_new@97387